MYISKSSYFNCGSNLSHQNYKLLNVYTLIEYDMFIILIEGIFEKNSGMII